jgi:hypothetical protein
LHYIALCSGMGWYRDSGVVGIDPSIDGLFGISHIINASLYMWHQMIWNIWMDSYLYVPLGGRGRNIPHRVFNVMATFLWVAFWHDREVKLLV